MAAATVADFLFFSGYTIKYLDNNSLITSKYFVDLFKRGLIFNMDAKSAATIEFLKPYITFLCCFFRFGERCTEYTSNLFKASLTAFVFLYLALFARNEVSEPKFPGFEGSTYFV